MARQAMDRLVLPGEIGFDALVACYANDHAASMKTVYVGAQDGSRFHFHQPGGEHH